MPDHAAGPRCGGSARRCWEAICWRARGALIRLFKRPMSGRLALGELHAHLLECHPDVGGQINAGVLGLLFEPGALRGSNPGYDLVRLSLFHRKSPRGLTYEKSNPVCDAIEYRVGIGAVTLSFYARLFLA